MRHIDWNVTARLQVPHVRQFTEDRELCAWFLLDLSPSVDFGSRQRKRSVSEAFVAVMASMVLRHGNRAGAVLYGNAVDTVLPAKSGRRHVLHLMQRMRSRPASMPAGGTRLAELIERARPTMRQRSCVFVVSDFISEDGWEAPLARLAERHDVVAVRLFDPLEMGMPDLGLVLLQDSETGEQLFVDTGAAGLSRALRRRGRAARGGIAHGPGQCRRRHARTLDRGRARRRDPALRRCTATTQPHGGRGDAAGAETGMSAPGGRDCEHSRLASRHAAHRVRV